VARVVQRRPLEVVVGVGRGATAEQEAGGREVAPGRRHHQRRLEVLVADVDGQAAPERVQQRVQVAALRRAAHVHEGRLRPTQIPATKSS